MKQVEKRRTPKRFNKNLSEEEYLNRALQTPGQLDSAEWRWAFETLRQIRQTKRLTAPEPKIELASANSKLSFLIKSDTTGTDN
jgi:hypothetical protein